MDPRGPGRRSGRRRGAAWLAGALATAGAVCLVLAAAQAAPTSPAPASPASASRGEAAPAVVGSARSGPPTTQARPAPATVTPRRVEIAQIGVDTRLVELGLQDDGTVQVPQDPDRAGWFDLGPVPGAVGSSVILGHVDSVDGPAVFARLAQVRPGARIAVTLSNGRTERFTVRLVRTYANADFPAQRVYGDHGHPALTLVTCGGAYDAARGGYQSNVVVYAR